MSESTSLTPTEIAKAFLQGIKSQDKAHMRSLCYANATACLIREGKPLHMLIEDILNRISDKSTVEMDEVSHDEVEHIDGEFATVWTPYNFYEDGKLHHTGSNNFCLWKCPEKGWLITAVQDVARPAEGITNLTVVGGHDNVR